MADQLPFFWNELCDRVTRIFPHVKILHPFGRTRETRDIEEDSQFSVFLDPMDAYVLTDEECDALRYSVEGEIRTIVRSTEAEFTSKRPRLAFDRSAMERYLNVKSVQKSDEYSTYVEFELSRGSDRLIVSIDAAESRVHFDMLRDEQHVFGSTIDCASIEISSVLSGVLPASLKLYLAGQDAPTYFEVGPPPAFAFHLCTDLPPPKGVI